MAHKHCRFSRLQATPVDLRIFIHGVILSSLLWSASRSQEGSFAVPEIDTHGLQLYSLPSDGQNRLHQIDSLIRQEQWQEAVELILSVADEYGDHIVPAESLAMGGQRWVSLHDHIGEQLLQSARMHPPLMGHYRRRVDPIVRDLWLSASTVQSSRILQTLAREYPASSYGWLAKDRLAEIALEAGQFDRARQYWQSLRSAATAGMLVSGDESVRANDVQQLPFARPELIAEGVPTSLADVEARLVLVSILAGERERASVELNAFTSRFQDATGEIANRHGNLAGVLNELYVESKNWPGIEHPSNDAAGQPTRPFVVRWQRDLNSMLESPWATVLRKRSIRHVPDFLPPPASIFHPLVADHHVYLCNENRIVAIDLHTGEPIAASDDKAVLYTSPTWKSATVDFDRCVGIPQFQLHSHDSWLLAKMGSPTTIRALSDRPRLARSWVVVIDRVTGQLAMQLDVPDSDWAFEGHPVADDSRVYTALRRTAAQPELYVAAFNRATGRMTWCTWIVGAASDGMGLLDEITHAQVTIDQEQVFCSSQTGCIAALDTTGNVQWLTTYPRSMGAIGGESVALHRLRLDSPCVPDRGQVFVAPSDFAGILCLDRRTGNIIWSAQDSAEARSTWKIITITQRHCIVGGVFLAWLNRETGKLDPQVTDLWRKSSQDWQILGTGDITHRNARMMLPVRHDGKVWLMSIATRDGLSSGKGKLLPIDLQDTLPVEIVPTENERLDNDADREALHLIVHDEQLIAVETDGTLP